MKTKLLSILVCLFLLINIVKAQESNNCGLISVSAGMTKSSELSLRFDGMFSHVYNKHLSLGIGVGFMYGNQSYNSSQDYSVEIPLFINLRGNILKTKATPYYSLNFGYIIPLKKANIEYLLNIPEWQEWGIYKIYNVSMYNKGWFVSPEIGISYNKLSLGVEIMYGHDNYLNSEIEGYSIENGSLIGVERVDDTDESSYIINLKLTGKL